MNNQELKELIDEIRAFPKETEWVEFKKGKATSNEKLGQYLSGLSNAACVANQGFAYLIFGIDDATHEVVGTNLNFNNKKEGNDELEFWLRRMLTPSIRFEYFECQYSSTHNVELFRIPMAVGEPTNFKNTPWIRLGTSLTQLKKYPHFAKAIYNSQEDWSARLIKNASIEDLDTEAIRLARKKYKEKKSGNPIYQKIDDWGDATFLDKAKITIGGEITTTAIILLGKPESAHYVSPSVAQITWKLDTEEKAYEHFEIPLFLSTNEVLKRIRNVKYKFFPDNQLIATEVQKYDVEVILEALNNCIAHQDYSQYSRILLTEYVNKLTFSNVGRFYEGLPEEYSLGTRTPKKYRNKWLAEAMVNLNMIDTLGFGIHKMYYSQRARYFPLPDYSKSSSNEVVLEIYGHSIDENYSKLLIEKKDDLDLTEVILLDKVQKNKGHELTDDAIKMLRRKKLIDGRKPNFYISAKIAKIMDQKVAYTKNKGLNKIMYQQFIIQHIENHGSASRQEINELLMDKLPVYLTEKQRKTKIHNMISELSGDIIKNIGSKTKSKWILTKKKQRKNKEKTKKIL